MPGRFGIFVVIACAALGALGTIVTGSQPGPLLAVFLLVGTAAAGFAVRQSAAHLVVPVPALAYPVAALVAGIADESGGLSKAAVAVGSLQWFAGGFLVMLAATALALLIATLRWLSARQRTHDSYRGATPSR